FWLAGVYGYFVTYTNLTIFQCYHILSELYFVVDLAIPGQCWQRLHTLFAFILVNGGHDTAAARLYPGKFISTDYKISPCIFFVWLASGKNKIRTKAIDRQWVLKKAVEVIKRGLPDNKKGIAVGQAHMIILDFIFRVDRPRVFFGEEYQATRYPKSLTHPPTVVRAHLLSHYRIIPHT